MEDVLFPEAIKKEYLADILDVDTKRQYRAVAVRACIELLLEHLFYQFVESTVSMNKWNALTVYNKIELLKEKSFLDNHFYEELHYLRVTGNKGAHVAEHSNITDEQLDTSFRYLSTICTSLIFEYFKEYGMQSTDNTSTIFSCLQPRQRVKVLNQYISHLERIECDIEASKSYYSRYVEAYREKIIDETVYKGFFPKPLRLRQNINKHLSSEFNSSTSLQHYDELLLAIDKLSLAYLKSGSFFLAICTVYRFYADGYLTISYYEEMCVKLNRMNQELDEYPIAKCQKGSIQNLSEIELSFSHDLDKSFSKLIRCILTNEN
ncbi:DUF4145 domain-containing protein [Rheinheimera faecalis]